MTQLELFDQRNINSVQMHNLLNECRAQRARLASMLNECLDEVAELEA